MGRVFDAICRECGTHFTVQDGGGFKYEVLHCDRCGRPCSVEHADVRDAYQGYLRGLAEKHGLDFARTAPDFDGGYSGGRVTELEYQDALEHAAGSCECGGEFRLDARPRCPECRSTAFGEDPDGNEIMVD
jgi:hypothetical protein